MNSSVNTKRVGGMECFIVTLLEILCPREEVLFTQNIQIDPLFVTLANELIRYLLV